MADNPRRLSVLGTVILRAALVIAATCLVFAAIPAIIIMFILVAFSPESFPNYGFGHETTGIRVDVNITPIHPRSPSQRRRRPNPRGGQPSSPQSPTTPTYTWAGRYNSPPPQRVDTPSAERPAFAWRSPQAFSPVYGDQINSMPPHLPALSEPEPQIWYDSRRPFIPPLRGPYTSMDPLPPAHPNDRGNSNFSWSPDEPLPPARPEGDTGSPRAEPVRRVTATSMPGEVPMIVDESDEEALPVYERPPEYDDESHSARSLR